MPRLGADLGERVLVEEGPDWVEPELLDVLRRRTGLDETQPFTKWTALKQLGRDRRRPRYLGQGTDGPKGYDSASAKLAVLEAARLFAADGDRIAVFSHDRAARRIDSPGRDLR